MQLLNFFKYFALNLFSLLPVELFVIVNALLSKARDIDSSHLLVPFAISGISDVGLKVKFS